MKKKVKVSIIVPVYNVSKYLDKCLDSLVNQTLKEIEIICVNDASTDNSLDILNKWAQMDKRIVVINNPKNLGAPGKIRNMGVQCSQGEYIGFVDSDDWVDNNYFEALYNASIQNGAEMSTALKIKFFNTFSEWEKNFTFENKTSLSSLDEKKLIVKELGANWIKLYKKDFLQKYHLSAWEGRFFAEDNYFSILTALFANKIVTVPEICYHYRKHDKSLTAGRRTDKDFKIFDVYLSIYDFINKLIIPDNKKKEMLDVVDERIKQDFIWFRNDMNISYLEAYKSKVKDVFPHLYEYIFLPKDIIVSLTSYPARIKTVNQTIESLLNQTLLPSKIILWLAPEQFPNKEADLPQELLELVPQGLTINWYHDIRSYKKLIPTLRKYPDSIIVTADDDNLYQRDWLKKLYTSYQKYPKDIHCHRVTKFYYNQMFQVITGGYDYYKESSYLNKLVGLGGVLYPPHCFYKDILNEDLIKKLAPTNDDQWFWVQAALNGVKVRVVENPDIEAHYVLGTQESGLTLINDHGQKLFWKDFNRILEYYPQIEKLFIKETKKNRIKKEIVPPYKNEFMNWYQRATGKYLNLNNPKTFNEKIQWLKLYDSTPIKTKLADKYLVRDWIKEKIGEEYLIPLLGVYEKFEEIDFDKLPNQFVIKCNHGCGYNIIVKDKSTLDLQDIKEKLDKWMNENFAFKFGYELHYRDIRPKIIIEKFIENSSSGDLYDYKFWCFNGKVQYIQFLSERNLTGLKMAFYNRDWKKQSFVYGYPLDLKQIKKPENINLMIRLAEKLSKGFNHVRVDFYRLDDGTLYFGEMTFSTASGICSWNDKKINKKLGKLIKLPKLAYHIDTGKYYKISKNSEKKQKLSNENNLKIAIPVLGYKKKQGELKVKVFGIPVFHTKRKMDKSAKRIFICGVPLIKIKKNLHKKIKKIYLLGLPIWIHRKK